MRACLVQGSQQIWVAALWYWGNSLNGSPSGSIPPWWIVLIVWPLAVLSFLFAYLMLYGLPDYYRQTPPKVPNFLKTLFRRKLVLWFLGSEILRDYWLSGVRIPSASYIRQSLIIRLQPYGRNWSFLWSVPIPKWQILLLVIAFFIGVWALMMGVLTWFSKTHTWLLPVFAVGLGAPRWCQVSSEHHVAGFGDSSFAPTDALGNVLPCAVYSLGRLRWSIPGYLPLALARCPRCCPRCWSGYDPSANPLSSTRLRHARLRTNHRFHLCDGCTCDGSQSYRPRERVPRRSQVGLPGRPEGKPIGISTILDSDDLPDNHRHRILLVLPEGATWYVLSHTYSHVDRY